jgi:hypothetical protein
MNNQVKSHPIHSKKNLLPLKLNAIGKSRKGQPLNKSRSHTFAIVKLGIVLLVFSYQLYALLGGEIASEKTVHSAGGFIYFGIMVLTVFFDAFKFFR